MKHLVLLAACLVMFLWFGAGRAEAANIACFDWSCNEFNTGACTFNASCTELTQGQLWRYSWDFGDGTGGLTGNPVINHNYGAAGLCWTNVRLTVIPFSADSFSVSCEIIIRNCVGPAIGLGGRCRAQ